MLNEVFTDLPLCVLLFALLTLAKDFIAGFRAARKRYKATRGSAGHKLLSMLDNLDTSEEIRYVLFPDNTFAISLQSQDNDEYSQVANGDPLAEIQRARNSPTRRFVSTEGSLIDAEADIHIAMLDQLDKSVERGRNYGK